MGTQPISRLTYGVHSSIRDWTPKYSNESTQDKVTNHRKVLLNHGASPHAPSTHRRDRPQLNPDTFQECETIIL